MAIALPQAIAPAFVTSTFAYSIKNKVAGGNFVWFLLLGISACCPSGTYGHISNPFAASFAAVHSLTLKEPTHDWREEYTERVAEAERE